MISSFSPYPLRSIVLSRISSDSPCLDLLTKCMSELNRSIFINKLTNDSPSTLRYNARYSEGTRRSYTERFFNASEEVRQICKFSRTWNFCYACSSIQLFSELWESFRVLVEQVYGVGDCRCCGAGSGVHHHWTFPLRPRLRGCWDLLLCCSLAVWRRCHLRSPDLENDAWCYGKWFYHNHPLTSCISCQLKTFFVRRSRGASIPRIVLMTVASWRGFMKRALFNFPSWIAR